MRCDFGPRWLRRRQLCVLRLRHTQTNWVCPPLPDGAGLCAGVASPVAALRGRLRALWDSVSHRSPQCRRGLRCPFGCRRHHRQRSTACCCTTAGKLKKQRLKARCSAATDREPQPAAGSPAPGTTAVRSRLPGRVALGRRGTRRAEPAGMVATHPDLVMPKGQLLGERDRHRQRLQQPLRVLVQLDQLLTLLAASLLLGCRPPAAVPEWPKSAAMTYSVRQRLANSASGLLAVVVRDIISGPWSS